MSRGKRKPALHSVDGRQMTVPEIADMLGLTPAALYLRRSRLGGCSYQLIVDMYRSNQIGSDKKGRYLIDGRWMTTDQIAAELKLSRAQTLSTWRCQHRQPDGTPATMEAAVAYYRQYLTGEKVRWQGYGGGHPWKEYRVGRRTWTAKDVAQRFGVSVIAVRASLQRYGYDMARVIAFYEERIRRRKAKEEKALRRAERKILKIIGY